jgi:hypothetical protein
MSMRFEPFRLTTEGIVDSSHFPIPVIGRSDVGKKALFKAQEWDEEPDALTISPQALLPFRCKLWQRVQGDLMQ